MYGIPLKYLALALGAVALIVTATMWFNAKMDASFDAGVQSEVERVSPIVDENNRLNRELETSAQSELDRATAALRGSIEAFEAKPNTNALRLRYNTLLNAYECLGEALANLEDENLSECLDTP